MRKTSTKPKREPAISDEEFAKMAGVHNDEDLFDDVDNQESKEKADLEAKISQTVSKAKEEHNQLMFDLKIAKQELDTALKDVETLKTVKPSPQLERKGMTKQAPQAPIKTPEQQITISEVVQAHRPVQESQAPIKTPDRDTTNLKAVAILCATHLITITILATLFMFLWSNR